MTGRRRGGAALPAALATVAVSTVLAGAIAELTRVELTVARHRGATAVALAAADTCLTELVAGLPAGWDFGAWLAGPDGVPGTRDDGAVPASPGCTATAMAAAGAGEHVLLDVDGRAGDGRRLLTAVVGRMPAPGAAALLWLPALPADGAVRGLIMLDGIDAGDAAAPPLASLAAAAEPAALDAWMAAAAVATSARTVAPVDTAPAPLDAIVQRVRGTGHSGPETLVAGTPAGPTVALVDGDFTVTAALRGAGLLVVNGVLDVQGALDFAGVIVAAHGVRVASAGRLTVDGQVWTDGVDPLHIEGELAVRQRRSAVAAADGLFRLPRLPVLLGLRDTG